MPKIAAPKLAPFTIAAVLTLALGAALLAATSQQAATAAPASSPMPKGFECHAEVLSGSGAGFKSSQEESEDAAIANWQEKAHKIYPEATWETAKDSGIQCVKQGLYSKCFANGFPCRPKAE
jgi:hypothetical protein